MIRYISLIALATALAGCASSGPKQEPSRADAMPPMSEQSGMDSRGQSSRELGSPRALDEAAKVPEPRLLHFEFDKATIDPQYQQMLKRHADYLGSHPQARVRLEGHADERGTREYNMGLGERRALMVQKTLLMMGVRARQLSSISYGEEKPAVVGRDERSYRENRRVEMVYGPDMASR